jgi:signal transduction histidine kinase/CheY-like chemotaxis protein
MTTFRSRRAPDQASQQEESFSAWKNTATGRTQCSDHGDTKTFRMKFTKHIHHMFTCHIQILLICVLIFAALTAAGITLCLVISNTSDADFEHSIYDLAEETGKFFASELDLALLPLFSLAQFAVELEIFADLPNKIGPAYQAGSLPILPQTEGSLSSSLLKRNVTGVCDDPQLVQRFAQIASAIEKSTGLVDQLQNLQLSPYGVVCLMNPYNNTEDFDNGLFLDSSKVVGLDLLNDQANNYIARQSITSDEVKVSIAGPKLLAQCVECGLYFIARLPVVSDSHSIVIDGVPYARWGFASALIQWENLVLRGQQREKFRDLGYEFQLTRTDHIFNDTTQVYDEIVFVLAESDSFGSKSNEVSTALQTTNNEWVITVQFDYDNHHKGLTIAVTIVIAFLIAALVYVVLVQKQMHTTMIGQNLAQEAKLDIERKMTAYFAHELRNPLSAIDSALAAIPSADPNECQELLNGMKLCSTFMTSIMNNLLDVRKLEEGKLILHTDPLSLEQTVNDTVKMARPTLNTQVELRVEINTAGRDWVLGDISRINQILTNIVSNAIKYTLKGSVVLVVGWNDDLVQFECRDTGPGIPKEDQSRMFERFVHRGGAPGSGLGLAIVKQMVTLMGGTIHFESDPRIKPGTNCIVRLPLKLCEIPSLNADEADVEPLDEPVRILIVDDIKMNRMMLKRRLQKDIAPRCDVFEASTGEEAITLCSEGFAFDVIVMDQFMEEAGGVLVGTDAIISIRRMQLASIIIGCSGNDLAVEFISAGADIVWSKPMPSNIDIIKQLREHLQRQVKSGNGC